MFEKKKTSHVVISYECSCKELDTYLQISMEKYTDLQAETVNLILTNKILFPSKYWTSSPAQGLTNI